MSLADNKLVGRRFFEDMLAKGDWAIAEKLMSQDIVMHHPSSPTPVNGREAVVGFLKAFRAGFPDLKMVAEDVFGEGNKVAVRWRASGTHEAELFGIPPTGKSMNVAGISILRIVDGKIVEDWVSEDSLGLMQQLGIIPAMG
ncbi:MAG: ester cyclase [Desulfobacterales bacterium]|nr:MAG: ester cyclase [Desulfobacterales bacterium]